MSSDQKVEVSQVSEAPRPLDDVPNIPGFEFELEENVSTVSTASTQADPLRMPNFDENRHPQVKLFVIIWALLGCFVLIYQSCRDLPREYRSIICRFFWFDHCSMDLDMRTNLMEYFDFIFRFLLEFVYPICMILLFVLTHLSISVIPGLAYRIRNPIPMVAKIVNLVLFFHFVTNCLKSISMLPYLGTTVYWSFWKEYLTVSGLGLFWMHQLLNMSIFSRLTVFNFIRARENFRLRQDALDDLNL